MRALITVALMLTVSPFVATFTLVCWNPDRWGGTLNPLAILVMGYFGLLTFPGLLGYLLALVTIPWVMSAVSRQKAFYSMPLPVLLLLRFMLGAVGGLCVMAPVISKVSEYGFLDLVWNWAAAGAVSGGVTMVLIVVIYRKLAPSVTRAVRMLN